MMIHTCWWFMIGKAKMIQLIHNGSSRRLERKMKRGEKKLFLSLCLDVQSVSVLQGGCDFSFFLITTIWRGEEIKNWEIYKVGDIKFRREIIATDRKWFIRKNWIGYGICKSNYGSCMEDFMILVVSSYRCSNVACIPFLSILLNHETIERLMST